MELNSKGLYRSSGKEKGQENGCLFSRSLQNVKLVVQRRQRNVQKSVLHVQSCCFACLILCFFAVLVAIAVVVAKAP